MNIEFEDKVVPQNTGKPLVYDTGKYFKRYNYIPQKDITAYELAIIMPILLDRVGWHQSLIEALPEEAARHFVEVTDGNP